MGNNLTDNFREYTSAVEDYIESSLSYHKLDLFKKVMKGVVAGSYQLILGFFLLIALLFLSIALSIFLGELLDSIALGYLLVGGFYLFVMILCFFFLKKILEKILVRKASIQFFNNNEDKKAKES